jgi:hypothetical protein
MRNVLIGVLSTVISASTWAISCPGMPQQTTRDYSVDAEAAASKVGPVRGPSVSVAAKSQASDVLSKYPNADKVYVMQMMLSTYCSGLEADKGLAEREKSSRFESFSAGVLAATYGPQSNRSHTNANKVAPRQGAVNEIRPLKPKVVQTLSEPKSVKEPSAQPYVWLDKPVSILLRYATYSSREKVSATVTTNWRELFGMFSPYLVSRPGDHAIRVSVTRLLVEKYVTLPAESTLNGNVEMTEDSWQTISIQFRINGLAKLELLESIGGGAAMYWGETPTGIALMKQIRSQ